MALVKTEDSWQFNNESDLEEVIWRNLPRLLNLTPFKRQFAVKGQYCDILAVEHPNRLSIIELKNTADRYIVQQLTRYYDAITEVVPFGSEIDLTQTIRLIAISPHFHPDTLTDCKYSALTIELIQFQIQPASEGLNLLLSDISGNMVSELNLDEPLPLPLSSIPIPPPPRKLLNWLSQSSEAEFDWVMRLRKQLLGFDPRMKEIIEPQSILYGRNQSSLCCELKKVGQSGFLTRKLAYFLWLPDLENKSRVLRMMVGLDTMANNAIGLQHTPNSYNGKKYWEFPKCIQSMKTFGYQNSLALYSPLLDTEMNVPLTQLVKLALQTWFKRL
jgi:Endonuclease NucS